MKTNSIDILPPIPYLAKFGSQLWAKLLSANKIAGFFKM